MKRAIAILLLGGFSTILVRGQQPPPPPPPPPANSQQQAVPGNTQQSPSQQPPSQPSPSQPSATEQNPSQPSTQQNPSQPNSSQPGAAQQNPSQQSPSQPSTTQQSPSQQNTTEPNLPQPQQTPASPDVNNLPQSDRAETERDRIEVEREVNAIREERRKEVAEIHQKDSDRLRESRAILRELLSGKTHISNSLLRQAKCVIVIPSVKKLASGVGMKYGRGVMSCHLGEEFQGTWSAPSMYALEGGNFGFQIGVQATDLVLLVMNDRGVDSLLGSKVKLGGDMSVAAGPIGRAAEISTDLAMRAKLLAYSRNHGIFVGIALDGSTVRPDNHANEVLYGREITAREIVRSGTVAIPRSARPLIEFLEESTTHVASEGTAPQGRAQQH